MKPFFKKKEKKRYLTRNIDSKKGLITKNVPTKFQHKCFE